MDDLNEQIERIMDDTGLDEATARQIAEDQARLAFRQRSHGGMRPIQATDARLIWHNSSPKPKSDSDESTSRRTGASNDSICPVCKGAGYLVKAAKVGDPEFGKLIPCTCLVQRQEVRAQEQRTGQAQRLLSALTGELGNLAGCTFESFNPNWAASPEDRKVLGQAMATCLVYARNPGQWLYLWGDVGTGKSHLAAAIAQQVAAAGTPTSYVSAPALFRFVRSGMSDRSADARIEALHTVDLLVIDDLGTEHLTAWATTILFDLINQRYIQDRPTVFTSNIHFDALPDRIADRIAERATVLRLAGSSYRRKGR